MTAPFPPPAHGAAPPFSLGVLAGGKSSRFGEDKAAAAFAGGSLASWAFERLGSDAEEWLLSGRSTQGLSAAVQARPLRAVEDSRPGQGPLAAARDLLAAAKTDRVVVLPCDQPLLPPSLCAMLAAAIGIGRDRKRAAVIVGAGHRMPLPIAIHVEALPVLDALLAEGARRMDALLPPLEGQLAHLEASAVAPDPERWALNVNTPEEYARARELLEDSNRSDRSAALPSPLDPTES